MSLGRWTAYTPEAHSTRFGKKLEDAQNKSLPINCSVLEKVNLRSDNSKIKNYTNKAVSIKKAWPEHWDEDAINLYKGAQICQHFLVELTPASLNQLQRKFVLSLLKTTYTREHVKRGNRQRSEAML
jgi:hypothetical protein